MYYRVFLIKMNMFKRFLFSSVIFTFLAVPLLCCCAKYVQAATKQTGHCDASKGHSNTDPSGSSCDCPAFILVAENAAVGQLSFPSFNDSFAFDARRNVPRVPLSQGFYLADLSPPTVSVIPLYIQYHNLRI